MPGGTELLFCLAWTLKELYLRIVVRKRKRETHSITKNNLDDLENLLMSLRELCMPRTMWNLLDYHTPLKLNWGHLHSGSRVRIHRGDPQKCFHFLKEWAGVMEK